MRIVDREVEVFGIHEELGLKEALFYDVFGEEELSGRFEGFELGKLLLGEIGIELIDGVTLVLLHYFLAYFLQVVGSIGYLGIVAWHDLVVDLGGGKGIDEGENGSKFFLLRALDVLPREQIGHLADFISHQRRWDFLLKVLELPDYVFID